MSLSMTLGGSMPSTLPSLTVGTLEVTGAATFASTVTAATSVTIGPTAATKFTLKSDSARITTAPVSLLIPSAASSCMVLDLMPTAIDGAVAANAISGMNAFIDVVDRDINASANTSDWAVARVAITAAGTPTGTATVQIGGFRGGAVEWPTVQLTGGNIFFVQQTTAVGFIFSGGLYWGQGGGQINGAKTVIESDGDIFTEGAIRAGGTNAQYAQLATLTELHTLAAAGTSDTTIQIPAGAMVVGVSVRVTTLITGCTTFDVGVAGATTRYGTGIALAATTTNATASTDAAPTIYQAATAIRLSAVGGGASFTAGVVRVTVHYIQTSAPTA